MGIKAWPAICNVCLLLVAASGLSSADTAQRIFILEMSRRGVLCGYTNEAEWAKVPKEKDIEFIAVASLVDGVLTSVLVERFSEDTATYDEYAISGGGSIRQLKRTLDVIPERVTREQVWDVRGGRAIKVSESWMEFRTHKPRGPDKDLGDLVENPIIVRVGDFPFHRLIADKHPERWPEGSRCIPGNMDRLEAAPLK